MYFIIERCLKETVLFILIFIIQLIGYAKLIFFVKVKTIQILTQ